MTVKEKINNLLLRMTKDDFNFSNEDAYLIRITPELQDILMKKIIKGPIKMTNLAYDFPLEILLSRDFSHEETQTLIYNIVYMFIINDNGFDINITQPLEEYFSLDSSTIEKIKQLAEDIIKDPEYSPNYFGVNDRIINICLDCKNYKLLSKAEKNYNTEFSQETITRMINEFPFTEYGIPSFFKIEFYNNYPFEKASIEHLLDFWQDTRFYNPNNYPKSIIEKCKEALIEHIKNSKDLSYLNNNSELLSFINNLDFDEQQLLLEAAYERGYLPAYKSSYNSKKEFQDRLIELINEGKTVPDDVFCDDIIDLSNPILINYVIKHGIISKIIEYDKGEYLKPYEDEIVKEIAINPAYAKEFNNLTNDRIFEFPKIAQALFDNNCIEIVNLWTITPEIEEIVFTAVKKNPKLVVYALEDYKIRKIDIICQIIKNKNNYKYIFNDDLISTLTKEEFEKVYKALEVIFEDLYEATEFTVNKKIFVEHPKLFDLYFGKEILTEHILEFINHNEEFDKVYNMSSYNKLKDYLINKYKLNERNLDLLVNKVGPNIIRYIENDSIIKLLTISYEELEKILNLFPDVTYTLNELNSSYDSLTQFMFGKENPEIISIFPSFLHAIEDKNINAIYRFKQTLIINTKKETFEKIKEKYKLDKIKDLNELLNLIVHGIKGPHGYLYTDILHDLTDEYISNERTNYRNNRYFYKLYPSYKNIFLQLLYKIYEGEDISDFIKTSAPYIKRFYNRLSTLIPITEELKDPTNLMNYVIKNVKDQHTRTEYLPILKEIVDYCCEQEKAEHSKELSIANELGVPYDLDKKNTSNVITTYIIAHPDDFEIEQNMVTYDLIELITYKLGGLSKQIIIDCCKYISGNKTNLITDEITIKKNIPSIIKAINSIMEEYTVKVKTLFKNIPSLITFLDGQHLIKRNYQNPTVDLDLSQILINLDINIICNTILNDEELYNKLLDIMTKKKLHKLPKELKPLIDMAGISDDYTNIASFITFFKTILSSERARLQANGKNPNEALSAIANILVNAEIYSSISSVYSQILGTEDTKLIKANPKPNDATRKTENNQRLKEAVELTKGLFTRREVTIPSFDKDIPIGNNKKLNAIVGNFTDPSNLTHGERTGACMRIGGVGETLFEFCLKNPNGFHIRFEDPETHEYISRVSGFRNGNTVFLNELRYSCNQEKYSNEDVVEACRLVSEELIELSKNSTCPIENVVIAKQYALSSSPLNPIDLEVDTIKKGLPKFYSDVDNKAIVLATTTPPFKKIDFNKSRVPTYEPCRGKIIKTKDKKELSGKINRIVAIKQMLEGTSYETIKRIDFPTGLLYGIVADDWYIYVDRNKEIKYDCLNVDHRAKEELSEYLLVVEELLQNNEIEEENEYGL